MKTPKTPKPGPVNTDPTGTAGTATAVPLTDPTGSVGAEPHGDREFLDIASGGANFVARMKKHADMVERTEKALAALALGKDIEGQKKRADALIADAELQNKKARDALSEAQAKAADIVDKANKKAEETNAAALDAKRLVEEEAVKIRRAADDYATKVRADIDAARDDVNDRIASAKDAEEKAKTSLAAATASAEKMAKATAVADARAKDLKDKTDRLLAVINEVKP